MPYRKRYPRESFVQKRARVYGGAGRLALKDGAALDRDWETICKK